MIFSHFETRFVDAFKNQIIDKTNLNLNYSKIHFSLLSSLPYGSFILDDAIVLYSKEDHLDTLLSAKKISFKINVINLFKNAYLFPEIVVSDCMVNLNYDKLDFLFSEKKGEKRDNHLLVETKRIEIKRCWVKYRYRETLNFRLFLENAFASGSFLDNSFLIRFYLKLNHLTGFINKTPFVFNNSFTVSNQINQRDGVLYTDNGKILWESIPIGFSFIYQIKTNDLQVNISSQNISSKIFNQLLLSDYNTGISGGMVSFNARYKINFNSINSQNLSIKYAFRNLKLDKLNDISIFKLEGTTIFSENFDKNTSEINNFLIQYSGFEFKGSAKVKNLPQPIILIDTKLKMIDEYKVGISQSIKGSLGGNIKLLLKLNNINSLDLNTLRILKYNSEITFSNLSLRRYKFLNNLTGKILISDDVLLCRGSGLIYNSPFEGSFSIPNIINVVLRKAIPSPSISIDLEQINIDSIAAINNESDTSIRINYQLNANIKQIIYKEFKVSNLSINLKGLGDQYQCDFFSLNAFNGVINGSFLYSQQRGGNFIVSAKSIDICNLFKCFNNFGQTIITNKNISGSLSGNVSLSFNNLSKEKMDPLSIKMISNIVVEKGRLVGVDQLRSISKFLKLREIDSIRFNTLHNSIDINKGSIKIPSMSIATDALNFTIAGQHDFSSSFSYWIKVNIRELLVKRYLANNGNNSYQEKDGNKGLNLFLKISGDSNSYKIGFDKENSLVQLKNNFNQEGRLLKSIIKEEFRRSKNEIFPSNDSLKMLHSNKVDSVHNKNQKKPFKIEWDEIDSTKNN
jgi:hypothetical protein